ncbi:hypothetical protein GCM10023175_53110 [Pseudonocardia xishanensis]|uniref:HTH-like domain-containing protein n=1 Tax=Pseudonocardia xishanensis TaxID=630995 RepID=A0ABP8S0G3_9PSEU
MHHDDPEFGYRFIADELTDQGWRASRNRVNRLCTLQQLWSVHARRRGSQRRPGPPVHDDLVGREFTAQAPDLLWFTDIERHEAPLNRVKVGDLHCRVVVAAR